MTPLVTVVCGAGPAAAAVASAAVASAAPAARAAAVTPAMTTAARRAFLWCADLGIVPPSPPQRQQGGPPPGERIVPGWRGSPRVSACSRTRSRRERHTLILDFRPF